MNTYRLSILKLLKKQMEQISHERADSWKEKKTQTEILLSLAACLDDIERELSGSASLEPASEDVFTVEDNDLYQDLLPNDSYHERRDRRQNFRQQNFDFWQGFIETAYENPEFASQFNFRRPAPVQWLRFFWDNPENYCLNVGYDRRAQALIVRFDLKENYDLFTAFFQRDEFEMIEENLNDLIKYYVQESQTFEEEPEPSELYARLMEMMLSMKQKVLAAIDQINAVPVVEVEAE